MPRLHEFEVIHLPEEGLTEAQLERIREIQDELEEEWRGATGLASGKPSPGIGSDWGLLPTTPAGDPQDAGEDEGTRSAT